MINHQTFSSLLIILLTVFINTAGAADIRANAQKSTFPPVAAKAEASSSQSIVVGNKDTKLYHLPGMPYYNKVEKYQRIYFDSEQQAIDNGYYKAGTGKDLTDHVPPAGEETLKKQTTPAAAASIVSKETSAEVLQKNEKILEINKTPSPAANVAYTVINHKIVVAFVFLMILFALPFLPAIVEIIRKQDADPLFISMNHIKDPRYFCMSFKQMVQKAIVGLPAGHQIREVMLSKKEDIQITESLHIPAAAQIKKLLCVQGDMVSAVNVHFKKEVYVSGNADIGAGNILQVLAAEGNITIAAGTTFERWLDAQGNLDVGSNCQLGISASCGGRLYLADDCSFRRLYGMPITTGEARDAVEIDPPAAWPADQSVTPELSFIRRTDRTIAEGSMLSGHVIFLKDVRIGHHSVVYGSIKCYGDIELEENVTVHGNIFADGNITIGKGAIISGHIFSQNEILIFERSVISRQGVIKSVLGKKSVRLAPNVTIYGYISTEERGTII